MNCHYRSFCYFRIYWNLLT